MPEAYVTLFNSVFLPQGLALHASMERHFKNYVLWILCVDDEAFDVLGRLDLPNVRRLRLSELESPDLLAAKQSRTLVEYCWTVTPLAPRFVFEADQHIQRVTYIDADLWFLKNPKLIFDEFNASGKQVLITDHAYSPEYDHTAIYGRYCVQFMIFSRTGGETVRKWWEERCLEWCFARFEDGRFGDQKYLDDWPERFGDVVHVLRDKELALAPWNSSRFPYGNAVFYHFHGLRLISKDRIEIGNYFLPNALRANVYQAYFADLRNSLTQLQRIGMSFLSQSTSVSFPRRFYLKLLRLKVRIWPLLTDTEQRF
jgi:hypothetical protein